MKFFGELLITLGVVCALFVAWLLWWTDVEAMQVQDNEIQSLTESWQSGDENNDDTQDIINVEQPSQNPSEVPTVNNIENGSAYALLYVPRWGDDYERTINEGTSTDILNTKGIGHYASTANVGEIGNFALAGHRMTHGKPFNKIDRLKNDDAIVVRTEDNWYIYKVTETHIVLPNQSEVLLPVPSMEGADPTERYITLTSCHPEYSTRERYIVHGVLDYWQPVSAGQPEELSS